MRCARAPLSRSDQTSCAEWPWWHRAWRHELRSGAPTPDDSRLITLDHASLPATREATPMIFGSLPQDVSVKIPRLRGPARTCTQVAIIGAGPYGLSVAAYLRARRIEFRIFG